MSMFRTTSSIERQCFARLDYLKQKGTIALDTVQPNALFEYGLKAEDGKNIIRWWQMNHNTDGDYAEIRTA